MNKLVILLGLMFALCMSWASAVYYINITEINMTSSSPDDLLEPFTSQDITPTFSLTTNTSANCYISDTNDTYYNCTTTGGRTDHVCTLPLWKSLTTDDADYVWFNCSNTSVNYSTYMYEMEMLDCQAPKTTYERGLVAHWKFEDGNDETGNHLANGSCTFQSALFGNGLNCTDGDSWDYMSVDDADDLDFEDDFSICFWANSHGLNWFGDQNNNGILMKSTNPANYLHGNYNIIFLGGNGIYAAWINDANTAYRVNGYEPAADSNWHHFCFVFMIENNTLSYVNQYLDSVLFQRPIDYSTGGVTSDRTQPLIFDQAASSPSYGPFNGTLDDFRIYNRSLSTIEVDAMYQAGQEYYKEPFDHNDSVESLVVAHWGFENSLTDKIGGNTLQNCVGNYTLGKYGQGQATDIDTPCITDGLIMTPSNLDSFSWCHWFNISNIPATNRRITDMGVRFDGTIEASSGKYFWWFTDEDGSGHLVAKTTYDVCDGAWHQACMVKTPTGIKAYIDGAQYGSTYSSTKRTDTETDSYFYVTMSALNYTVDDVMYFNTSLTDSQVEYLYYIGAEYYPSGENCSDGIKNGDEEGIDCGGSWCNQECWEMTDRPNRGVMSRWDFDGDADDYYNKNNGTVTSATNADGLFGNAYLFDGSTSLIDVNSVDWQDNLEEVTISAWVYGNDTTNDMMIFTRAAGLSNQINIHSPNEYVRCVLGLSGSGSTSGYSLDALTYETWHFVACTYDGSYIRVYKDGIMGTPVAGSGTIQNSNGNWDIGHRATAGKWKGSIDEVRIYNRSLSAKEIWSLYQAGANRETNTFCELTTDQDYAHMEVYVDNYAEMDVQSNITAGRLVLARNASYINVPGDGNWLILDDFI